MCDVGFFLIDELPEVLNGERVAASIDGMNYIHISVNRTYSLTTWMHNEQLAHRVMDNSCFTICDALVCLDVHFDDPQFVPLAKTGEQTRSDESRSATIALDRPYEVEPLLTKLDLNSATPKQWEAIVLGIGKSNAS